jgi:hypothetical protein
MAGVASERVTVASGRRPCHAVPPAGVRGYGHWGCGGESRHAHRSALPGGTSSGSSPTSDSNGQQPDGRAADAAPDSVSGSLGRVPARGRPRPCCIPPAGTGTSPGHSVPAQAAKKPILARTLSRPLKQGRTATDSGGRRKGPARHQSDKDKRSSWTSGSAPTELGVRWRGSLPRSGQRLRPGLMVHHTSPVSFG